MAKKQGLNRLTKGFSRKLTNSEILRGYLFISMDKEIQKLNELSIVVNGKNLGEMKLDSYGRVGAGKSHIERIGNKACFFKLEGRVLNLKY